MRYRTRVTIETPTAVRSPKGATTYTWAPLLEDVPATIVPSITERRGPDMTTIADTYDVVLAGRRAVDTKMAVLDEDGRRFAISQVDPLLGERQTRLVARLIDSPTTAEPEGS